MSEKRASGFTRWLIRRRNENTIIGDLAFDVYNDSNWPLKAERYHDLYDYLQNVDSCDGAMEAFEKAWNEYKGIDSHALREDIFYTCDEFYSDVISGDFERFDYLKLGNVYPRAKRGRIYIYVLFEIQNGNAIVKYVGQTIDPLSRLNAHVRNPDSSIRKRKWVNRLRHGIAGPYMAILDNVEKGKSKHYEEMYIFCFAECERGLNQGNKNILFNKAMI